MTEIYGDFDEWIVQQSLFFLNDKMWCVDTEIFGDTQRLKYRYVIEEEYKSSNNCVISP